MAIEGPARPTGFGALRQEEQPGLPLRRRLPVGGAWVVLGRVLGVGVTTLVNVAFARWLSPEDFGSFVLLSSVLAMASLLAMLGLNAALVRFVAESVGQRDLDRARRSVRLVMAVAAVSITSVTCLAAVGLSYFGTTILGLPNVPGIVPMAVTSVVLLALLQLIAEGCRGLHEMRLASLFSGGQTGGLLSNVLFLLLIAGAVAAGKPSLSTAVALNVAAMSISLPVAIFGFAWAARTRLGPPAPKRSAGSLAVAHLLRFSVSMLTIQLLVFATTQSDLWIAGIWCPRNELALYGAARRLTLLVALPLQMLNLTVISSIAELHGQHRHRDLEQMLRRAALLAALPSVVASVVLIVWGGPVLELLFGSFFRQAALPLGILGVGQLFLVAAGSCGCLLEMTGNQTGSLLVNLATALALAVVGTWAARQFGILGLAVASTSIIAAQSITLWLLAKRIVGVWTHPTLRPSLTWS
ncbi:MAG: oligosaccharide flippase family protein [Pirellulales bacterium]